MEVLNCDILSFAVFQLGLDFYLDPPSCVSLANLIIALQVIHTSEN